MVRPSPAHHPTDVYAEYTDAAGAPRTRVLKLLSVDPSNYPDAPREGIRRVLEAATGVPHPRGLPLDTSRIAAIRMGTTVGGAACGWVGALRACYALGLVPPLLPPLRRRLFAGPRRTADTRRPPAPARCRTERC